MPELPEVETTRRGLEPRLEGKTLEAVEVRDSRLRWPIPPDIPTRLAGRRLRSISRRGKYLLFDFGGLWQIVHLGMSGSLRFVAPGMPPQKHDHADFFFDAKGDEIVLRLADPRRFGALLWLEGDPLAHPLLARLGIEPLERGFTPAWLHAALRGRSTAIKPALMDSGLVVGVGNIYAAESLFDAGIDPRAAAGRVSATRLDRLVPAIKQTLRAAIRAGGSTLRDFRDTEGGMGDFQLRHKVYGREGEPCFRCGTPIRLIRQGQRATCFCPRCQR